ncbi:helix-turn-helix domain-containing protein [Nocardia sp. NPDC051787]|uniref:helix-turn-helix domain-containing protein n=1 Tax=Nocardia sp. NPDC051787 TaxID=3155415 RepID=UPI00343999C0
MCGKTRPATRLWEGKPCCFSCYQHARAQPCARCGHVRSIDEESAPFAAARRLHVSRNTVAYRVKRAGELLGYDISTRRYQLHTTDPSPKHCEVEPQANSVSFARRQGQSAAPDWYGLKTRRGGRTYGVVSDLTTAEPKPRSLEMARRV